MGWRTQRAAQGSRCNTKHHCLDRVAQRVQCPSCVAGTEDFYAITRLNWSSYYAMAVIELAEAVAREMQNKP